MEAEAINSWVTTILTGGHDSERKMTNFNTTQ